MVAQERENGGAGFEITSGEPVNFNEILPKGQKLTVEYRYLEIGGERVVIGWFAGEKDYYGVYWLRAKKSPKDFLEDGERLASKLKDLDADPRPDATFSVETILLTDHGIDRREAATINETEGLNNDNLAAANLNTLYARFGVERMKLSDPFTCALITHIENADDFSRFIEDNCSIDLPKGAARKLLQIMSEARVEAVGR